MVPYVTLRLRLFPHLRWGFANYSITGALFHCDDSAQLAQSVRYWFSHTPERNAVAENAYNRARQYYSTKQMGDRFIELYQCVLNK